MLGHGAAIGYGPRPRPRMGPIDNFSLATGSDRRRICRPFVGVLDDALSASGLARRAASVPGKTKRDAEPQAVRPDVDSGRVHSQPQVRQFPHDHRAESIDPTVAGRHDTLQPASDVDSVL